MGANFDKGVATRVAKSLMKQLGVTFATLGLAHVQQGFFLHQEFGAKIIALLAKMTDAKLGQIIACMDGTADIPEVHFKFVRDSAAGIMHPLSIGRIVLLQHAYKAILQEMTNNLKVNFRIYKKESGRELLSNECVWIDYGCDRKIHVERVQEDNAGVEYKYKEPCDGSCGVQNLGSFNV